MKSLGFKIGMTDSRSIRITSFFLSPSKHECAIFFLLSALFQKLKNELMGA